MVLTPNLRRVLAFGFKDYEKFYKTSSIIQFFYSSPLKSSLKSIIINQIMDLNNLRTKPSFLYDQEMGKIAINEGRIQFVLDLYLF
jgi:hypothetical protein